jgi:protein-L-isoaspartate O-methyltransferase
MTSAAEHRRDLASALVAGGAVRSPWLQQAFEDTPREMFVPRFYRSESGREVLVDGTNPEQHEQWLHGVYSDGVLTVQLTPAPDLVNDAGAPTSSSSMPTVMAGMLEALDLQPGHRVLEIGTGTGYNAALLCHRVGADKWSVWNLTQLWPAQLAEHLPGSGCPRCSMPATEQPGSLRRRPSIGSSPPRPPITSRRRGSPSSPLTG